MVVSKASKGARVFVLRRKKKVLATVLGFKHVVSPPPAKAGRNKGVGSLFFYGRASGAWAITVFGNYRELSMPGS